MCVQKKIVEVKNLFLWCNVKYDVNCFPYRKRLKAHLWRHDYMLPELQCCQIWTHPWDLKTFHVIVIFYTFLNFSWRHFYVMIMEDPYVSTKQGQCVNFILRNYYVFAFRLTVDVVTSSVCRLVIFLILLIGVTM